MDRFPNRLSVFLVIYALTVVFWLSQFPIDTGEIERVDVLTAGLGLGFAFLIALLVFTLDLPILEIGWGIFTIGYLVQFLDTVAEGPEVYEGTVPAFFRLVGLAIILVGFARATARLRSHVSERNQRLAVLNRILRHNMRNSLSTILNGFRHFHEQSTDADDRKYASLGLEEARYLSELSEKARMIDTVLENAEAEGKTTVDLVPVVESTVQRFREEYPDVEFDLSTPSAAPVRAVEGIEPIIGNVVENACKHNDATDPHVTVTVENETSEFGAVTVRDNGPGIPREELVPLRKGHESALDHGSGLGLWLVQWFVEKSGGEVTFSYDGGQSVTLRFPAADRHSWSARLGSLDDVSVPFPLPHR